MSVSIDDFWNLAVASELLSSAECDELRAEFADLKGAGRQANARSLAQWLVATGRMTRYQAAVLASGRPGPFVLGPFVVTDRIEKGRLRRLYRATFEGKHPVLLVPMAQLTDDAQEAPKLIEAARAAAAAKSPHVSRTYNAVRHRSQTFVVVEPLAGQSLAKLLKREKLPRAAACQIGCQLALALVEMHAKDLVHGGVCPANAWLDNNRTAKLLQFPLVPIHKGLKPTEPPLVDYLAPELAAGEPHFTPLSDIYALGCLLFEMIAGRPVFPGGTPAQRVDRHRAEFAQRLDQLDPEVPEDLADVVSEMLEKDPLLRCQTASHVVHLLAPFVADTRQRGRPPRVGDEKLTAGYGAWQAPEWQSPPKQTSSAPPQLAGGAAEAAAAETPQDATTDEPERQPKAPLDDAVDVKPAIVVGTSGKRTSRRDERPRVVADPAATPSVALPNRAPSKNVWIGLAAGMALLLILAIGAMIANRSAPTAREVEPTGNATTPPTNAMPLETPQQAPTESVDASISRVTLVDDDGSTLWVSPTAGEPIDMAYVPNGTQVLLALRPRELWSSPEGTKLLDALGPAGAKFAAELRETLGVDPQQVEQLIVAFVADESHAPQAVMVMRLVAAIEPATLLAAWGNPKAAKRGSQPYFESAGRGYFLPERGAGRVVVIGPSNVLEPIRAAEGPPLLRRSVERLLQSSDRQRLLTVLFTPSYLLNDGRGLLAGPLEKLRVPLREFLDESFEAVLLSAHVDEHLFLELRAMAPIDRPPPELLGELRERFDAIPDRVEAHVASFVPHEHGRLVVNRFPRMLQLLRDYTRTGIHERQIVMRCYLPASAAHSLAMGAELTLAGLSAEPADARPTAAAATSGESLSDRLRKPITLSFPRDSLDRVMDVLADELGTEIEILGADLQLEGITKNQSLADVDERNQPAEAVLRKLLKLANPDGKLVYVLRPGASGAEAIVITTRAAVAKRGETLPPGF